MIIYYTLSSFDASDATRKGATASEVVVKAPEWYQRGHSIDKLLQGFLILSAGSHININLIKTTYFLEAEGLDWKVDSGNAVKCLSRGMSNIKTEAPAKTNADLYRAREAPNW